MKKILLIAFLFSFKIYAQGIVVAVGEAEKETYKIGWLAPSGAIAEKIKGTLKIIQNDLLFYQHLYSLVEIANPEGKALSALVQEKSLDYLFSFSLREALGNTVLTVKILSSKSPGQESGRDFILSEKIERRTAHDIADKLHQEIFKVPSIFLSKITFVSDVGKDKRQVKELFIMDFDGENLKRLTHHKGIVLGPDFSHDNKKILYSLIPETKGERNINLFLLDLGTNKAIPISSRPGINSGAIFNEGGESIYLTLNYEGNPDIYKISLTSKEIRKVTSHHAIEVDPDINRAGDLMAFLSNRSGSAMIYTCDPRGIEQDVKRISFVGQFNATPRFSPDGGEIVFSSWVDNSFDIYRIGSDGKNLSRLTKNFGSNEEPHYSKDGQFIIFTSMEIQSRRKAEQHVYLMNRDGQILGRLTQLPGRSYSPRWSN